MEIPIVRPFLPDLDAVAEDFSRCLDSGMVTNNSRNVRLFEERLQAYFGCALPPVCFANGESALFHLIQAWKHKLGCDVADTFDVLVPSFTFSGTVNAIVMNNLRPVFCDVDDTLTLDLDDVAQIDADIRMIVAVGVYGNLPDIDKLERFAERHRLVLLMDNAPAFGSRYRGEFPHRYGHGEIYSFHATKILSSMEGGAALVSDPEIRDSLCRMRDFGQFEKTRGDVDLPGLNAKMQEVSAVVGIWSLARFDTILEKRGAVIARYRNFFAGLERRGLIQNMRVRVGDLCTYLYYPVILGEEATDFVDYMNRNGIQCRRYYTAVHRLKYYRGRFTCAARSNCVCQGACREEVGLPFTNAICDRIVSLPLHTEMTDEEMAYLFETCENYFGMTP